MEYTISNGELYHHGIKGQRWGVRRFQNKDGSLTSKGRKRYGSDKDSAKKEDPPKRKSVKDMSDEELVKAIARARAEDTYRQLRPEKVPAGKRFMSTLATKVIAPAAISAGERFLREYLNKVGDDILKKNVPVSEKEKLIKENELLKLRNENKDLKKSDDEKLSWADRLKKQTYDKNEAAAAANKYKDKLEYEKSKKEYEDWKAENSRASKSSKSSEPSDSSSGYTGHKGMKWETRTKADKETYDGPIDIKGEGTSHRKNTDDRSSSNKYDTGKIYTDDWSEHTSAGSSFVTSIVRSTSNSSSNYGNYTHQASLGETFISGLLEAPKDR